MPRRFRTRWMFLMVALGGGEELVCSHYLKGSFHLADFNVRTLKQIGQAALARNFWIFKIVLCYVSETSIQDPTSVINLRIPDVTLFSHFTLRLPSDSVPGARVRAGIGITLNMRTKRALLDWIPVHSRSCALRLDGSAHVNSSRLKRRCLFVASVCTHWLQLPWDQRRVLPGVISIILKYAFNGRCSRSSWF